MIDCGFYGWLKSVSRRGIRPRPPTTPERLMNARFALLVALAAAAASGVTLVIPATAHAAIVGLWQFDNDVTVQPDASGNGNHATPNGSTAWVSDAARKSGVMLFDGDNDYRQAAHSNSLSITGDITIAAWLNVGPTLGNFNNWRGVLSKGTVGSGTPGSYQFWFNQFDLKPFFLRGDGTNQSITPEAQPHRPDQNAWEHWAVTMSGTTVTYYRNGTAVASVTDAVSVGDTGGPLYIGKHQDLKNEWLGFLDDMAIVNEASVTRRPSRSGTATSASCSSASRRHSRCLASAARAGSHRPAEEVNLFPTREARLHFGATLNYPFSCTKSPFEGNR